MGICIWYMRWSLDCKLQYAFISTMDMDVLG